MMVNKAYAAIGMLAGAAGLGSAGISVTLHFDLDGDPFNSAEVVAGAEPVSWTVFASFMAPDPSAYFGGYVGSFVPTGDEGGSVSNLTNLMSGEARPAVANGASVDNVNIFVSPVTQFPDFANPCAIFAFDYQVDASAFPGPTTQVTYAGIGTALLFLDDNIFGFPIEFEDFAVVSDVLIVPGPSAAGVLAFGLLTARRRR
jgi:hypothetical protein